MWYNRVRQVKSECTLNRLPLKNRKGAEEQEVRTLIEVKNLVKKYGDHYAVKDLSFQLESGKIYGFLGPNGAGKSTTMNMITGYIASTSGEVIIHGHDIVAEPEEAKKCIGYLPEIPPLYVDMTVKEYLTTVADLKGIPKAEWKKMTEEVMEIVKITDMQNRLIKNLSKGYRQRVGIAQAMIGYPEIIILDEPTVGLDPQQIIEIRELVKSLGEKHTVIISSHILSEISEVCDEVLIINKGRLVTISPTDKLEQMFIGAGSLELVVDGEEEKIRQVLAGYEEITSLEIKEDTVDKNAYRIQIQIKGNGDIRRPLFYQFAELKMPILEMKGMSMSLEDVFLQLTSGEEESGKADSKEQESEKQRGVEVKENLEEKENGSSI